MPAHNYKIMRNHPIKPGNRHFTKTALSGSAIALLLAMAAVTCFGCTSTLPGPSPAVPEKTATTVSLPDVPGTATSAKTMAYVKPDKLASTGRPLVFTISATDPDGDPLQYSASNLPDGAVFDEKTATFSWTPRYDQAGDYVVHFEVSDGKLTASEDIIITVIQEFEDWDINGDGAANILDIVLVGQRWGETGLTGWLREDANEDGTINVLDIIVISQSWTG